jgi:hypothetical protein
VNDQLTKPKHNGDPLTAAAEAAKFPADCRPDSRFHRRRRLRLISLAAGRKQHQTSGANCNCMQAIKPLSFFTRPCIISIHPYITSHSSSSSDRAEAQ